MWTVCIPGRWLLRIRIHVCQDQGVGRRQRYAGCQAVLRVSISEIISVTNSHNFHRWSAVARGAVAKGLEGETKVVAARKNRRHYGIITRRDFKDGTHKEEDATCCAYTGVKRALNQMNWLLKQGQNLPTSGPAHAKTAMHSYFWLGEERTTTLRLQASDCEEAPKRSIDAVCTCTFRLETSTNRWQGVYQVAKAKIDLSRVPKKQFKKKRSPSGQPYVRLDYDIELCVQSSLEMYLSIKGKRYGALNAAFE